MLRFFFSLFMFSPFSNGPLFTSCLIPCPLLSSLEFYFIPCDCVDCVWLSLIFISSQFLGFSLIVFSIKFVLNHKNVMVNGKWPVYSALLCGPCGKCQISQAVDNQTSCSTSSLQSTY